MAAVCLRARVNSAWLRLSEAEHSEIKTTLLVRLDAEDSRAVRRGVAGIVVSLAKHQLMNGTWPELIEFMQERTRSESWELREVAVLLFYTLTSVICRMEEGVVADIGIMLGELVSDPDKHVRIMAVKALCALMEVASHLEDSTAMVPYLSAVMDVVSDCVRMGEDDAAMLALDFLARLVEAPNRLLDDVLLQLASLCIEVAGADDLLLAMREAGVLALDAFVRYRPRALTRAGLMEPLLDVTLGMMSEEVDEEDEMEDNTQRIAQSTLDGMALNMPRALLLPLLLERTEVMRASEEPWVRRGGVFALGVIAEGCCVELKAELGAFLPPIFECCADSSHIVQSAACFSLGQLSEHCQPEMLAHADDVVPLCLELMMEPHPRVQRGGLYALQCIADYMSTEQMAAYLDDILAAIAAMLEVPDANVQEMALQTLSSTATSARESFVPHLEAAMELMEPCFLITDPEATIVRSSALAAAGAVAVACGGEAFAPYLPAVMDCAAESRTMEDHALDENSFALYAYLAQAYGDDFAHYVPDLVLAAVQLIRSTDGMVSDIYDMEGSGGVFGGQATLDADMLAEEDDALATLTGEAGEEADTKGGSLMYQLSTLALDAKVQAVQTLGSFIQYLGEPMVEQLPALLELFLDMTTFFHPEVRWQSVLALGHLMTHASKQYPTDGWTAGLPAAVPVPADIAAVLSRIMTQLCDVALSDPHKEVAARCCEFFQTVFKLWGPAALEPHLEELLNMLVTLLDGESRAQGYALDKADDDAEAGLLEHDWQLMDSVHDTVSAFISCTGESSTDFLGAMLPSVMRSLLPAQPARDRMMAMGTMAEITESVGPLAALYHEEIVAYMQDGIADEDIGVIRNSAYCFGVTVEALRHDCAPLMETFIPHLQALLGEELPPPMGPPAKDNIVSTLSRCVTAVPDLINMEEVLPSIVMNLPLREDRAEDLPAWTGILSRWEVRCPVLLSMLPDVMQPMLLALAEGEIGEDVQLALVVAVKEMTAEGGDELAAAMSALPEELAEAYAGILATE
eukprot:PLAT8697.1.p1 GENE.PLAT8697.1~~PLAT8697.1.p1  ORF type:complete len:1092 (+),score=625.76 PLAT8697.1:188-3277(+)